VSAPEQLAILPASTAELFDEIPLERITDAEEALRKAAAEIPTELRARLDTAEPSSAENRETVIETAPKELARFQPGSEPMEQI